MQIFSNKQFENPIKIIEAFDNQSFIDAFAEIEEYKKSHYIFGYIRYEAKNIFLNKKIKTKYPLLYFEVYKNYQKFNPEKAEKHFLFNPKSTISYKDYSKAIRKIKYEISCGNTYEVNYTYDYKIKAETNGVDLYNYILPKQTTPYNAYFKNKYEEILSFSPELFFELENNKIKTKPMKGTIKRGENEEEDKINIEFLQNDIKNRAENVMIVDLLRNDLGRIAKTGTVKVDKLFEIETHKTLHQMTSEISAELKDTTTLYDIFEAIFPCGSITGAPKINTMEIIDKVEQGKREVYCGAIGLISPEKTVFSVPIRILQKKNSQNFFSCRVGGAIVWDSTAKDEWSETLTKISFLKPDFQLVETFLVKNLKMKFKTLHFKRMKNSAHELGFIFPKEITKIKPIKNGMMRVLLSANGHFEVQYKPLNEISTNKVIISKTQVNSKENLLYHKTTYRPWYNKSLEKIKANQIFDEIYFNEKGELTEGSRSNILILKGNKLYTPQISCGLLNGVYRQSLIQQKKIKEKILYLDDVKSADKIYCINAVRGIVEVKVDFN